MRQTVKREEFEQRSNWRQKENWRISKTCFARRRETKGNRIPGKCLRGFLLFQQFTSWTRVEHKYISKFCECYVCFAASADSHSRTCFPFQACVPRHICDPLGNRLQQTDAESNDRENERGIICFDVIRITYAWGREYDQSVTPTDYRNEESEVSISWITDSLDFFCFST